MIDVTESLSAFPQFPVFPSVGELAEQAEGLANAADFRVAIAGTSMAGRPIHHVATGAGAVKALFVGFPDSNEPIGGASAAALLRLLADNHAGLRELDVEWHIVPCIDPDGAILNEGWSRHPFDVARYMRGFHRPSAIHQVDCSFPIHYKRLDFATPSREAMILAGIIEAIRPDFYYSLHNNSGAMGAWLLVGHDLGSKIYERMHALLARHGIPMQSSAPMGGMLRRYDEGIYEMVSTRAIYDKLAEIMPEPEAALGRGAMSLDHVLEVNPRALTFISELPCVTHPQSVALGLSDHNLRRLRLSVLADNIALYATMLELWARVEGEVAADTPFHAKVMADMVSVAAQLPEGLPCWPGKTRSLIARGELDRPATNIEVYETYMLDRFFVLAHAHEFARLLEVSNQSSAVVDARSRLGEVFDGALRDLGRSIDLDGFAPLPVGDLARAQCGTGLLALGTLL